MRRRSDSACEQCRQPWCDSRPHLGAVAQRMVAGNPHHVAIPGRRGHPERIAFALNDEHGRRDRLELGETALPRICRPARRMEREGQAEHRDSVGLGRGPTRHPCPRGATAGHERKTPQLRLAEMGDYGLPCRVELLGRRRGASAGHPVWLLDQRCRPASVVGGLRRGD